MRSSPINTVRLTTDQFFLLMAIVIGAVVIAGFGFTITRPLILYIHASDRCLFGDAGVVFHLPVICKPEVEKPMNIQTCISAGSVVCLGLLRA
jgi:hypothetical protein